MDEMITYIFSSLRISEKRLDTVSKILRRQKRFNNKAMIFAIFASVNMIVMRAEQKAQAKLISQLEEEIDKLKCSEGE